MKPLLRERGVHRWRRRALVLGGVFIAAWFGSAALAGRLATFLDVSQPAEPTDAVMALGGDPVWRPGVAAKLVTDGLARRALIPMVYRDASQIDSLVPSEHEVHRRVLLAQGVAAEAIVQLPAEVAS